jgi:hypothetical protein
MQQNICTADSLNKLATSVPQMRSVGTSSARTADGLSENPGSVDEVVRDLEDSGYPVDGATQELIRQPDGLSVATGRIVAAPVQLESAPPSEDGGTSGRDVAEQGSAADVGVPPRAILDQF